MREHYQYELYQTAMAGLNDPSSPRNISVLHGAVLTCCVVARTLQADPQGDSFAHNIWRSLMAIKGASLDVSKACLEFMVIDATRSKSAFCSHWVDHAMKWMCEMLTAEDDLPGSCSLIAKIESKLMIYGR